ncbi:MAG: ABC transporter permease [Treponema sp.]|jgi:peptide/nickel transport system permease protein|nr:ABC transporter permease [Treponema sp.]
MGHFVVKRILLGILVLLGVITITFLLTRVIPSDPAARWVGARATAEQVVQARRDLGLDKPILVQYGIYLRNLLKGDLGRSIRSHQPITRELASYLPATLELVLISTFAAILLGIPLGVLSAKRKDKWLDHLCRIFSVGAVSLPTFWVGMFLQFIFYGILGILPLGDQLSFETGMFYDIPRITGFLTIDCLVTGNFYVLKDALVHLVLPGITIALYPIGLVARMTRSALLEILNEDYIAAARSYSIPERKVLWSYALKNSLGPTATVITLSIGYTLVTTFLIEAIFNWPGIGSYISGAVVTMDYPAIMGVTIFSTVTYVILNMAADIIVALDPRVRV